MHAGVTLSADQQPAFENPGISKSSNAMPSIAEGSPFSMTSHSLTIEPAGIWSLSTQPLTETATEVAAACGERGVSAIVGTAFVNNTTAVTILVKITRIGRPYGPKSDVLTG